MQKITAPYNFVPTNANVQIVTPPSQDHPWRDGLCGALNLEVVAETPMFIRGTDPNGALPYKTPDGYALPGTSLRGMLRSTLEIASFSRLGPVNDDRYGFRDLQNRALYGQYMADIVNGQPTPLVSAGWLRKADKFNDLIRNRDGAPDATVAVIEVCDFAKVEYRFIERELWSKTARIRIGDRAAAPDRYAAIGVRSSDGEIPRLKEMTVPLSRELLRPHNAEVKGQRRAGEIRISNEKGDKVTGRLVLTGQPSPYNPNAPKRPGAGNPKHHDFLFYGPLRDTLPVSLRTFRDFEFVHRSDAERHGIRVTPNAEWGFWRAAFEKGHAVPVFLLQNRDGTLRAFGLAMMFRLAYALSIGEAVKNMQPIQNGKHRDFSTAPDFAEALFGRVNRNQAIPSYKGRVSVGLAKTADKPALMREVIAVLGTPKPTFYPNYIENSAHDEGYGTPMPPGGLVNGEYRTLMNPEARLRGWKRYVPQEAIAQPPLPEKASDKVKTRFQPLPAGTRFQAKIRVHNLRPHELGALLWATDFGGHAQARHVLGMARSLGYGRARLAVTGAELDRNDGGQVSPSTIPAVLAEARAAFKAHMERWAEDKKIPGGWEQSIHIQSLIACAVPLPPGSADGRHLDLNHPSDKNQFTGAKKQRMVLIPRLDFNRWRDQARAATGRDIPQPGRAPQGGGTQGGTRSNEGRSSQSAGNGGYSSYNAGNFASPARPVVAQVPTPPPAVAAATPASELRQAFVRGQQFTLVRAWIKEGGAKEAERRAGAREVFGANKEKMRLKYADIVEWMER